MEQTEATIEALKAEFPNQGICLVVGDALGTFRFSTNINKIAAAAMLDHVAKHLRGECQC